MAQTATRRTMSSPYMEWAKLSSTATYNLATSGVMSYPLSGLPVRVEDLEINGPDVYGYAPLQEALAKKFSVDPACVVAAAGTSFANHLAMAALFEPGDEVVFEQPTYEPMLSTALYLGANLRRFQRRSENGFGVDIQELERAVTQRTRLIVLCNLHNPSSALVSQATLREIGEIAGRVGARVLVDEVYLEALFENAPPSAFYLGEQFAVTSSLTKAYGLSGLRSGWILAQPDLAKRMWRLNDLFAATPAHPAELLSVIALANLDRVARRAQEILAKNHASVSEFLDSRNDLEVFRPGVGTTVFPRVKHGNADEFADFLRREYDTSIVPGRFFEMPEHFRIGLGGDPAVTAEGLQRLSAALDRWK
jgi:aspartate/methionine/tyrosine aminotransferase